MPLRGEIRVPSDKSISHRAVMFSGLAAGTSVLRNILPSDDVYATIHAMRTLGAIIDLQESEYGLSGTITGFGNRHLAGGPLRIDCANSGTTARLMMGILAGLGVEATLVGDSSLSRRPMKRVIEPLVKMGARIDSEDGHLPVTIHHADDLRGVHIATMQASAQVKSSILLAGLNACGTTTVIEPSKSRDHTERMLSAFGASVRLDGLAASLEGPTALHACDFDVAADPSSASFIAVACALIPGSDVLLKDVVLNKTRTGAFDVLERMGCEMRIEREHSLGNVPIGDIHVSYNGRLCATRISPSEIPSLIDEIPILSLAAALAEGETIFESAGELRVKECDRFAAILDGLSSLGVKAYADGDDLHIVGIERSAFSNLISFPTYHDHRMAMTWYLAGVCLGFDAVLDDERCVCVSWPQFFDDIDSLRT